jgi:hypothetical protein
MSNVHRGSMNESIMSEQQAMPDEMHAHLPRRASEIELEKYRRIPQSANNPSSNPQYLQEGNYHHRHDTHHLLYHHEPNQTNQSNHGGQPWLPPDKVPPVIRHNDRLRYTNTLLNEQPAGKLPSGLWFGHVGDTNGNFNVYTLKEEIIQTFDH